MGASPQGCAQARGRSRAPDLLQGQNEVCRDRGVHLPQLRRVSGRGRRENRAGMGHPIAKPPWPHATVSGDETMGTCGQGKPTTAKVTGVFCPMGRMGSPQSNSTDMCSGLFLQPQRRCCEFQSCCGGLCHSKMTLPAPPGSCCKQPGWQRAWLQEVPPCLPGTGAAWMSQELSPRGVGDCVSLRLEKYQEPLKCGTPPWHGPKLRGPGSEGLSCLVRRPRGLCPGCLHAFLVNNGTPPNKAAHFHI